ncbi:MAG: TrmB family transcriptional regulator [Halodesulfovibrio sp.]
MELIQALKKFGFTQQESLMYVTLSRHGGMTGYEAAKVAGISRSNAYAALSSLVEKGGAVVSSEDASNYVATPKEELLLNLKRSCARTIEFLEENLPEQEEGAAPYLTVSGYENTLDKMRNMMLMAELRIYISMHSTNVALLRSEISGCVERGLKVVILSNEDPGIRGAQYMKNNAGTGNVKLIADTSEVIVGLVEVNKGQCLYSKNKHLVYLMREALLNEIELIRLRGGMTGD